MIIYSSNALQFRDTVDRNQITVEIEHSTLGRSKMSASSKSAASAPRKVWNLTT